MNLKQTSDQEKDFLIPTYQRLPVMMVRGEGCSLFDNEGKEYLCENLCLLMVLAFLIDQVQELCCPLFQALRKKSGSYRVQWERMRVTFEYIFFESWEDYYSKVLKKPICNTS